MSLFFAGCPSNVPRFVSSIVIDTIEGASRRRFSDFGNDFGQESLEDLPSFARHDASTAVIRELFVVGVEAAIYDGRPAGIDRRSTPPWCMSVYGVAGDQFVSVGAATTGDASSDIANASGCGVSAVAFEFPDKLFSLPAEKTDSDKSSEALTTDIFEGGHDGSSHELLCQVTALRSRAGPLRYFTTNCGVLQ